MKHAPEAKIHSLCPVVRVKEHGLEATVVMETVALRPLGQVTGVQGMFHKTAGLWFPGCARVCLVLFHWNSTRLPGWYLLTITVMVM